MIKNKNFDLRDWQKEDFLEWVKKINSGEKDFLTVATPGSGKTRSALYKAYYLLYNNLVDRIVVVTYTDYLKRQWAKEAAIFAGIDLDPDFNNSQGREAKDFDGIVITYALLGQDKIGIHKQNTLWKRTFVILDEIHHAGENLVWGNALLNSFQNASYRLALSGTPFRSDDCEIPFIKYINGISKADYTYSLERAIQENVCRPIFFNVCDGKMKWKVDNEEFQATFNDYLTKDQASRRLRTSLEPNSNYVKHLIIEAHNKLLQIRNDGHKDAGGLITCIDQNHAKQILKIFKNNIGIEPLLVISDEAESRKKIEDFAKSDDLWLVSVKMVSEGVDIPRLRVGGLLTNVKTKMYFRQFIGRFVRVLANLKTQDAFIFIPADRDMIKLAENIQDEVNHALYESKRRSFGNNDVGKDLFGNEMNYTPALKGKFIPIGADAINQREMFININIGNGMKEGLLKSTDEDEPIFMRKEKLRAEINRLAMRVAKYFNRNNNGLPDFKIAHKLWIEKGGKPIEIETIDELKKRLEFYYSLLK